MNQFALHGKKCNYKPKRKDLRTKKVHLNCPWPSNMLWTFIYFFLLFRSISCCRDKSLFHYLFIYLFYFIFLSFLYMFVYQIHLNII